jgi:septal ring factor EnvC (AmiA/AmiB activator)
MNKKLQKEIEAIRRLIDDIDTNLRPSNKDHQKLRQQLVIELERLYGKQT